VETVIEAVVVGEGDVEGVEFRAKGLGGEVRTGGGIGVVVAAVVFLPLGVPGGGVVGSGVSLRGTFADPKDGSGDILPPGINDLGVFRRIGRRFGGNDHPGP